MDNVVPILTEGLIAVCKHRYPLLRIVGFWKIAMIVIALLGWVSTVATNGGGRAANHAADSYWRVAGAQQCAEWGSGLLPLENDLSGWDNQVDWSTAPTLGFHQDSGRSNVELEVPEGVVAGQQLQVTLRSEPRDAHAGRQEARGELGQHR